MRNLAPDEVVEMIRAEIAAEAMTAGEQTGYCETCAGFDMTGWDMDTINKVLDRVKERISLTI